jgi:peptidoglycan L-alanyl-D-glutamate endopeptidase CwlK
MENGQPNWNKPINSTITNFGIKYGFEWGDWRSFKDYPHFEMTFGRKLK